MRKLKGWAANLNGEVRRRKKISHFGYIFEQRDPTLEELQSWQDAH
jgi:hypothetical protein